MEAICLYKRPVWGEKSPDKTFGDKELLKIQLSLFCVGHLLLSMAVPSLLSPLMSSSQPSHSLSLLCAAWLLQAGSAPDRILGLWVVGLG